MKILALDLSTRTGWSVIEGEDKPSVTAYGIIREPVEDFNVNSQPPPSCGKLYPWNVLGAAAKIANQAQRLIFEMQPDVLVVENTVKGANRHTQRILEWIHCLFMADFQENSREAAYDLTPQLIYMDPSEWRKILEIRLSSQDKKNNRLVSQGKKRGRVGKKHLSVRWVNDTYGTTFKLKDNDICDSICLGTSCFVRLRDAQKVEP